MVITKNYAVLYLSFLHQIQKYLHQILPQGPYETNHSTITEKPIFCPYLSQQSPNLEKILHNILNLFKNK